VLQAREAIGAMRLVSLDRPAGVGEDEDGDLGERIGDIDPGYGRAEASLTLAALMQQLPARERTILALRFDDDLTQSEIGERMGISQMHVSRLLRRTLADLGQRAGAA
jgi:RNA polymerase sigma-B factor